MKRRKTVVFTLVIVMLAMIALSVNTALAGSFDRATPPTEEHPPVCHKVNSYVSGVYQLECFDEGKDIVNVSVKSESKYELNWDSASVTLMVYPANRTAVTFWIVQDKAGNVTSGRLP